MPRQLPWKVGSAAKQTPSRPKVAASAAASASASGSPAPSPSHRPTPTPKAESTPGPSRTAKRRTGLSSARSPSNSPPPEPLKEEFMIEGLDNDDKYRMVEDEFLAVAGEFTRHLHAAEYQRLKGLAKSENAEAIEHISRPVTGEMTDLVKRRHAALDTAARQHKGIARTLGKRAARDGSRNGDEEEPKRRPATSLQGLMDSPRKHAVLLSSVSGTRPGSGYRDAMDASPSRRHPSGLKVRDMTRHSSMHTLSHNGAVPFASVGREPTTDSGEDDDDLEGSPPRRPEPDLPRRQPPAPRPAARTKSEPGVASNPFLTTGTARRLQTLAQQPPISKHNDARNDQDEDDDFFARLRVRRAEQKRRRESKAQDNCNKTSETQAAALNSIPFI